MVNPSNTLKPETRPVVDIKKLGSSSLQRPTPFERRPSTATMMETPPPTANTLKSKERAALVRTTRKLEQVLGVAMKVVDESNTESTPPSNTLICTQSTATNDAAVLRLLTTDIQTRSRSSSVTTVDTMDSTCTITPFPPPHHLRKSRSHAFTSDSTCQRQRLVSQVSKLHRHFGEAVPADLMVSPTSPASASNHNRSLSLWPARSRKLRKGGDRPGTVESEVGPRIKRRVRRVASVDRSTSEDSAMDNRKFLTSRSVDIKRPRLDWHATLSTLPPMSPAPKSGDSDKTLLPGSPTTPTRNTPGIITLNEPSEDGVSQESGSLAAMTPKEKSLNVRRAMKMAQRFGDAPPQALFQITNIRVNTEQPTDAPEPADASDMASLSPFSPRLTVDSPRHKRASNCSSLLTINTSSDYQRNADTENKSVIEGEKKLGRVRGSSVSSVSISHGRPRGGSVSSIRTGGRPRGGSVSSNIEAGSHSRRASVSSIRCYPSGDLSPVSVTSFSSNSERKRLLEPKPSVASIKSAEVRKLAKRASVVNSKISKSPITCSLDPPSASSSQTALTSPSTISLARPSSNRRSTMHSTAEFSVSSISLASTINTISPRPSVPRTSTSSSFTTRRRRARKLSTFFGVDYPDLYQAMVIGDANSSVPPMVLDEAPPPLPSLVLMNELKRKGSVSVNVHKKPRESILPVGGGGSKESMDDSCRWSQTDPDEVKNVLHKLRELKA